MCQSKANGGKRCDCDANGTRAVSYEAEREYGFSENFIRKVITLFRKEAIHNGISDENEAPQQEVEAFAAERRESIEHSENMSEPEKRTALRRWARAVKEKVSMATFYSWKKVSALMMAGSMAVMLTACTHSGENKVPDPGTQTSQAAQQTPGGDQSQGSDADLAKQGAFGYDFSTVPVPDKIKKTYGKAAAANILNDTFTPMEVMKSSESLYKPGKQDPEKRYAPLKAFMTPEAWRWAINYQKHADNNRVDSPVITVYASGCDDSGSFLIVKKGKKGEKGMDNYSSFTCDPQQKMSNVKLSNLKVDTYKARKSDTLTHIDQHIKVTGTMHQTYTGHLKDSSEPAWQVINIDFSVYLAPDGARKDHWKIDGADYNTSWGKSSLQE